MAGIAETWAAVCRDYQMSRRPLPETRDPLVKIYRAQFAIVLPSSGDSFGPAPLWCSDEWDY